MAVLGFTLPSDSGEKLSLGRIPEFSQKSRQFTFFLIEDQYREQNLILIEVYKTVELVFHVRGHNLTFPDCVPEHGGGDDACHLLQPPPR